MKKTDLAYMAGIFDGEGSICLRRVARKGMHQCYLLEVSVGNTNEWIIQQFKFAFGGFAGVNRHGTKNHQVYWQWSLAAIKAGDFLKIIYPYLKIKKPQAELAIKFQEQKTGRRFRERTDAEKAIEEAQRITMVNLHRGKP